MHIPEDKIVKTTGFRVRCLYCGSKCLLCCSSLVYYGSKRFGHVWICPNCEEPTYVGADNQTLAPLGHPANASLRKLRSKVHKLFDPLWDTGKPKSWKRRMKKYVELGKLMGLPRELCHIAMMNENQCLKAIEIIIEGKITRD